MATVDFGGLGDVAGEAYDGVAGVGDHLAGSVDESIGRQFDDEEGGGFGDFFTGDERSDFVLQPGTVERGIYDTLFDYEGTWGGEGDSADLWGPSWDPADLGDMSSGWGTGIEWRNPDSNDPTNPDNWGRDLKLLALGIGGLGAVYVLGQLFTVGVGA
ncbi:hypothetical protein [Halostella salina]|uniref:hypothetical protein n=1 Tax=Halostella salina TaxID=1547897 RepID=UPI000EF83FDB|nr:hypothetical protein [Halostella salina]